MEAAEPTHGLASRRFMGLFAAPIVAPIGVQLALGLTTGAFDVPEQDAALAELYTLHASRLERVHGAYSRFGWHPPGPLACDALAPLYARTGLSSPSLFVSAQLLAGVGASCSPGSSRPTCACC